MDELTRFARILVERLGSRTGGASNGAVSVQAIRKELLPYRTERRNLGLSSVEDYEMVLLRLVAEERGFVKTVPARAAERSREVLAHPNPDLGVLDEIGDATIQFTSLAAAPILPAEEGSALGPRPSAIPEEPGSPTQAVEGGSAERRAPSAERREPSSSCLHCRGALPAGRTAVFCPWCGQRLIPLRCERCDSEIESGWRHCISCGAPVPDPDRPS